MKDVMDMVARTDAGREEYLRLTAHASQDADAWQAAADGMPQRGDALAQVGDVLTAAAVRPLRRSVEGVAIDGGSADAAELYRDAYAAWQDVHDTAKAMEHLWYAPHSPAPACADAMRLLTWQLRDAHDELDWLARTIGSDAAARIRADVLGPAAPKRTYHRRKPKATPRFRGSELDDPTPVYREIALLQDRAVEEVRQDVEDAEAQGMRPGEAMVRAYGAAAPRGVLVGIDLETTGLSPYSDYIVDAGWERYDLAEGRAFDAQRHTYGISAERAALGLRRQTVELNGIDVPQLEGFAPFQEDVAAQRRMMEVLEGATMVAHHARFERHFLTNNCAGFAEAVREGSTRILDSRMVAVHADDYRSRGFTLEDYARRHGAIDAAQGVRLPATDGGVLALDQGEDERHLGLEDTHIMMEALHRHLTQLHDRFAKGEPVMVDDESTSDDEIMLF